MTARRHFQDQNSFLGTKDALLASAVENQDSLQRAAAAFRHHAGGLPADFLVRRKKSAGTERIPVLAEKSGDADGVAETISRAARMKPAVRDPRRELTFLNRGNNIQMRVQKNILHSSGARGRIKNFPSLPFLHLAADPVRFQKIQHHGFRPVDRGHITAHGTAFDKSAKKIRVFVHSASSPFGNSIMLRRAADFPYSPQRRMNS